MDKEVATELSLLEMRLIRKAGVLTGPGDLRAVARTSIPDEVKAEYLSDQGVSTVQADVHVDAVGEPAMGFHGVVRVKLAYRGNLVKPPPAIRRRISRRLQYVAQKHCLAVACKELVEQTRGRRIT